MKSSKIANVLWGDQARFIYLFLTALFLLLTFLGARDIWTQEHRWADIVSGMFFRNDFLHPYLGESTYYDKPLLSYWLIAIVATLTGELTTFALRLPSVCAGLLAIWSIYRLGFCLYGKTAYGKSFGLIAAWLLLTTYYFIFWSRTSSADMLNLAGSLFAVTWYFEKKHQSSFVNYSIFFLILSLTSLCKGLVGAVVPVIAVLTDIVLHKSYKSHLRLSLLFATIPAAIVYILPFLASSITGEQLYQQNGLYLVYKENILRYFQAFDHKGPIYTYFIYLPIYLLPWTPLLIPTLWTLKKRWSSLSLNSKWIAYTLLMLFLFFSLSGSRRSYYVLPMVPFAILLIADWLLPAVMTSVEKGKQLAYSVVAVFIISFIAVDILPTWYYSQVGVSQFAALLKKEASDEKPWKDWDVISLDGESKLRFYLQLPPNTDRFYIKGKDRVLQTRETLLNAWPFLKDKPKNTIFISRRLYLPLLEPYFRNYRLIALPKSNLPFTIKKDKSEPIAWIPSS